MLNVRQIVQRKRTFSCHIFQKFGMAEMVKAQICWGRRPVAGKSPPFAENLDVIDFVVQKEVVVDVVEKPI